MRAKIWSMASPWTYHNWGTTTLGQREPDGINQDAAGISLNGWPFGVPGQWNDVIATNPLYYVVEFNAVIPEPSSVALMCGALICLAGYTRWKRGWPGR
jgi:hypothetical protein